MTRIEHLNRERDMLLKAYTTANDKEKRKIMLKIMNIDNIRGKDTYGKKSGGYFTRRRNKIIYVN